MRRVRAVVAAARTPPAQISQGPRRRPSSRCLVLWKRRTHRVFLRPSCTSGRSDIAAHHAERGGTVARIDRSRYHGAGPAADAGQHRDVLMAVRPAVAHRLADDSAVDLVAPQELARARVDRLEPPVHGAVEHHVRRRSRRCPTRSESSPCPATRACARPDPMPSTRRDCRPGPGFMCTSAPT